jgi:inhibitor of cysteine peptidase
MKAKLFLIGLIGITLLTVTACVSAANEVSLDESSSGQQIEIASNGVFTVTLESNQTTGYSWELKEIGDTSILQKTSNEYIAPDTNLVGAGGQEVWTFKALKAGETTLTMEYSQPWEGGDKANKTFSITVIVK